jgi:hypothetical protein
MKPYDELDPRLQTWIQSICDEDQYGLRPQTLYNNIALSTGDEKTLASLFEVPLGLIRKIKETDDENH